MILFLCEVKKLNWIRISFFFSFLNWFILQGRGTELELVILKYTHLKAIGGCKPGWSSVNLSPGEVCDP